MGYGTTALVVPIPLLEDIMAKNKDKKDVKNDKKKEVVKEEIVSEHKGTSDRDI